jgi:hypothetical protein
MSSLRKQGPITTGVSFAKGVGHLVSPESTTRYGPRLKAGATRGEAAAGKNYTAAVVTPPSTTMVCPVMKVEASEAR